MDAEREAMIAGNLAAGAAVLKEIAQRTGIVVATMGRLSTVDPEARRRLSPLLPELIDKERNSAVRLSLLYELFDSECDCVHDLWKWYATETEERSLEALERLLVKFTKISQRGELAARLLTNPKKLQTRGLLFLCRMARSSAALKSGLRLAHGNGLFDLERLAVIANEYPGEYAILSGAGDSDSDRLKGPECHSIVQFQLPENEYWFRRPDLVPYYAKITGSMAFSWQNFQSTLQEFCAKHGMPLAPEHEVIELANLTDSTPCIPVLVEKGEMECRAVVLSRLEPGTGNPSEVVTRSRHRRRERLRAETRAATYQLRLVVAPVPRGDNLFPKRLLPPDDPIRHIRPER